jgi:hypothetical protein
LDIHQISQVWRPNHFQNRTKQFGEIFMNTKRFFALLAVLILGAMTLGLLSTPDSVAAAPPISINFQSQAADVPVGFIRDFGQPYGARTDAQQGTGETYGWISEVSVNNGSVPVDLTATGRDRDRGGFPQQMDTLIHMEHPLYPAGAWEYAIATGTYQVTVSTGDEPSPTDGYDSVHVIHVEGITAIDNFQPNAGEEYRTGVVTVGVTDGRLTIDSIGGANTKLNYVIITPVATPDDDNDGVNNLLDNCPNTYGEGTDGCPVDSDNDGINNSIDQCDNTPGPLPTGCPAIPPADADGDGFSDAGDACPTVAGVAPDGCPRPVDTFELAPDNRANWRHGDLVAAVYPTAGDNNEAVIDIYCVNENSEGSMGLRVTNDDLAAFPAQPASNTAVASANGCPATFYILTSGEYQINIGPDANGDVRVMIFNGLEMLNMRYDSFTDFSGVAGSNSLGASGSRR